MWKRLSIEVNGLNVIHYFRQGRHDAPLAWVVHGWTSGSMRMLQRADSFVERGWNVLMVDLPGHGGSDSLVKWSAEETTTHLIASMNEFSHSHSNVCKNGVWFFGHSLGSFVDSESAIAEQNYWRPINCVAGIFESPMTGYTEIHNETCNLLRIPQVLRPWVLTKTI